MSVKQLFIAAVICIMCAKSNTAMAQQGTNTLSAGQKLTEGQRLISANKMYYLVMQADGNLSLKKTSGDGLVWSSMVDLGSGHSLTLQTDGNLVIYNKDNKSVWNSMTQAFYDPKFGTADNKPVRAVLEDNGTLNLYSATNKKVWESNYKGEQPTVPPTEGFVGVTTKKQLKIRFPNTKASIDAVVQITNTGQVFYDGDINLGTLDKVTQQAADPFVNDARWPNSTIPYVLPRNHPRYDVIKKGIDEMNKKTNLCLVPRTTQTDYVEFVSKVGNWSNIGRVGGRQEISIENKVVGTVCHEIMHALGFYHTQSREDRDNYVSIDVRNVQKGFESNFQKESDKASNLGSYDYGSCMHYHSKSFAIDINKNTISPKNTNGAGDAIMGQRDSLSHRDILNINEIYPPCQADKKPYVTKTTATTPAPSAASATSLCDANTAVKKYQTSMKPGDRLAEKEKLVSANGRYHFRVTTDGNFVIEEILTSGACPFQEIYRFPINNSGNKPSVSIFSYNPDGNICMDSKQGKSYCITTGRDAAAALILQKSVRLEITNDGRLVLINKDGQEIWTTPNAPKKNNVTQPATQTPAPTQTPTNNTACGLTIKYKGHMTPGNSLLENEILVSADGRYQLRHKEEQYVVEEVLNRNNCQFKTIEVVSTAIPRRILTSGMKDMEIVFKYESNGDIVMNSKRSQGDFSRWNAIKAPKGDMRWNIVNKSTKLELTNNGILRLVNGSGQVIWEPSITKQLEK